MSRYFEKVSYSDRGILPTRADNGSAGYDFHTLVDFTIPPKGIIKIMTGIKCKLPENEVLMLYVRSSIGIKKNLMLANGTGIVDSSFYNNPDNEGDIAIVLYNYGDEPQTINAGDRIAQGVILNYQKVENDVVLSDKRTGGIGSSGK